MVITIISPVIKNGKRGIIPSEIHFILVDGDQSHTGKKVALLH
jgi:hypothetical protein